MNKIKKRISLLFFSVLVIILSSFLISAQGTCGCHSGPAPLYLPILDYNNCHEGYVPELHGGASGCICYCVPEGSGVSYVYFHDTSYLTRPNGVPSEGGQYCRLNPGGTGSSCLIPSLTCNNPGGYTCENGQDTVSWWANLEFDRHYATRGSSTTTTTFSSRIDRALLYFPFDCDDGISIPYGSCYPDVEKVTISGNGASYELEKYSGFPYDFSGAPIDISDALNGLVFGPTQGAATTQFRFSLTKASSWRTGCMPGNVAECFIKADEGPTNEFYSSSYIGTGAPYIKITWNAISPDCDLSRADLFGGDCDLCVGATSCGGLSCFLGNRFPDLPEQEGVYKRMCCKDDSSEFFDYFTIWSDDTCDWVGGCTGDNINDKACLIDHQKAVFNGEGYFHSNHDDFLGPVDIEGNGVPGAIPNYYLAWVDCDISESVCKNDCGYKFVQEGEHLIFGEFGNGLGSAGTCNPFLGDCTECCGDDPNEYYVSGNGYFRCCNNPTDTVDINGNCKENVQLPPCGNGILDSGEECEYTIFNVNNPLTYSCPVEQGGLGLADCDSKCECIYRSSSNYCRITDAYWSVDWYNPEGLIEVHNNSLVYLVVKTENCEGNSIQFTHWEDRAGNHDQIPSNILTMLPHNGVIPSSGRYEFVWNALWFDPPGADLDGNPDYKFKVVVGLDNENSNIMTVTNENVAQHKECLTAGDCLYVDGAGADLCDDDRNCGGERKECVGLQCLYVSCAGLGCTNVCEGNSECSSPDTHAACVGEQCLEVEGSGIDTCSEDINCGADAEHKECVGIQCLYVDGTGINICQDSTTCLSNSCTANGGHCCVDGNCFGSELTSYTCPSGEVCCTTACGGIGEELCQLTRVEWCKDEEGTNCYERRDEVANNTLVYMFVEGSDGCNGEEATLNIYEDDLIGDDHITEKVTVFSNNVAQKSWRAIWTSDGGTDPEYYFKVEVGTISDKSFNIIVNQTTVDEGEDDDDDDDGYVDNGDGTGTRKIQTNCIDDGDEDNIGTYDIVYETINLTTELVISTRTEENLPCFLDQDIPFFDSLGIIFVLSILIGFYLYKKKKI
ncbi:MAG: hypothetical protein ABIJ20_03080 [Nanoarchaeota archaeon]|nr:hypothetical protein [Nanoarchaeota archaeon]MBU1444718.1 hypothetical protein [Nanoarchaeota archaeon]MBU2420570.1 hypothetical protein [Nanoarchaeota archaeon]MBU2475793.1 hypothetical protein [Nanoarchaeota archaeon]